MHIVSCMVALGGDMRNVAHVSRATWPEISILQEVHGPDAITDVKFVEEVPTPTAYGEKERLGDAYDAKIVDKLYPGRNPRFEWDMPGYEPKKAKA